MRYPEEFENSQDFAALTGTTRWNVYLRDHDDAVSHNIEPMITFWMHYAWSAFCLQWIAIAQCALVGRECSHPDCTWTCRTPTPRAAGGRE